MKVKVKISEVIKYLYPAMLPLTKELKECKEYLTVEAEPVEECKHEWVAFAGVEPIYCKKCRVLKPAEKPESQSEWVKELEQEFPELQKLMAKGEYQFLIEHFKEQLNKFAEDILGELTIDYDSPKVIYSRLKKKWGI